MSRTSSPARYKRRTLFLLSAVISTVTAILLEVVSHLPPCQQVTILVAIIIYLHCIIHNHSRMPRHVTTKIKYKYEYTTILPLFKKTKDCHMKGTLHTAEICLVMELPPAPPTGTTWNFHQHKENYQTHNTDARSWSFLRRHPIVCSAHLKTNNPCN